MLEDAGDEARRAGVRIFLVGGVVRDLLLGRPISDMDFVVEEDAKQIATDLSARWKAKKVDHPTFGTHVLQMPDRSRVDVARARSESYDQSAALPRVRPGTIEEDLRRRDFTINAMAVEVCGKKFGPLLDPTGGRADLSTRRLRVLHPASFRDDPTRSYRAARFSSRFGFRIEPGTLRWLRESVKEGGPDRLTAARLRHEIEKILADERPWDALALAGRLGLLRTIHPLFGFGRRFGNAAKQLDALADASTGFPPPASSPSRPSPIKGEGELNVPCARFAFLLCDFPNGIRKAAIARLQPDSVTRKTIESAAELCAVGRSASVALQELDRHSVEAVVAAGAWMPLSARRVVRRYLAHDRHIRTQLTGDDLRRLGLTPGPLFARILSDLTEMRRQGEVQTKEEEIARVQQRWITNS